MNVWRSLSHGEQWTDDGLWDDREFVDEVASNVHGTRYDIRRVAVIRIKSLKEK